MLFSLYSRFIEAAVHSNNSVHTVASPKVEMDSVQPVKNEFIQDRKAEKIIKSELYSRACSIYSRARKRRSKGII